MRIYRVPRKGSKRFGCGCGFLPRPGKEGNQLGRGRFIILLRNFRKEFTRIEGVGSKLRFIG